MIIFSNTIKTTLIVLILFIFALVNPNNATAQDNTCGLSNPVNQGNSCTCESGVNKYTTKNNTPEFCCGWISTLEVGGEVFDACTGSPDINLGPGIDIKDGVTDATLDMLNPLKIANVDQEIVLKLSTPGGIISRLLVFLFPLSGLTLFIMIVWGGFEILIKSTSSKAVESGKNRITAAIVGFLLLFSSYWLVQIIEVVFGIAIL